MYFCAQFFAKDVDKVTKKLIELTKAGLPLAFYLYFLKEHRLRTHPDLPCIKVAIDDHLLQGLAMLAEAGHLYLRPLVVPVAPEHSPMIPEEG